MTSPPAEDDDRTVIVGAGGPAAAHPSPSSLGHNALDVGTKIGEFEILGLVGEGGFGIVYLAYDHSLDRKIALKEYMPSELAQRQGATMVVVKSQRHADTFAAGLKSFINEARLLARFDNPSLVKVHRFWEANGTAYMVMPFYEGITLKEALHRLDGPPDEAWLRWVLAQLLDALEIIHSHQCYHRDIAPDNILILRDDTPLLLDFGAARRVIGDMTQALTVILKPGYAPIEQYAESPNMKQGAWTDLYALASVVYFAITGKAPVPSVARVISDPLVPLTQSSGGHYSDAFLQGIDAALAVRPQDRPQNISEFRRMLGFAEREVSAKYASRDDPVPPAVRSANVSSRSKPLPDPRETKSGRKQLLAVAGAVLGVLLLSGYLLFIFFDEPLQPAPAPSAQQPSSPPAEAAAAPEVASAAKPKAAASDCAPYCEVISALAPYVDQQSGAPKIGIKGGAPVAYEGESLVAEVTAADFPGYVYADLYDPEGNVLHMLPNSREKKHQFQARHRITLGDDPVFGVRWDIVPPLGKHLLVVMAGRSRMFNQERPQSEPVAAYLGAVRKTLSGKAPDEPFAVHYALIDFLPKR